MINIVLYGPPACGKGTQANILCDKLNLFHINTGELLRDEIKRETELGSLISSYIDNGNLVPDEVSIEMVTKRYLEIYNDEEYNGFIFDGFPRSLVQKKALDKALYENGESVDVAVEFRLPDVTIFERLKHRAVKEGRVDDQDDEKIRQRISHYNQNKKSILDSYNDDGLLITVDGTDGIDTISTTIESSIYSES